MRAFAAAALRDGVSVAPGTRLSPDEHHADCVRLAFVLDPDTLTRGVERLAETWDRTRAAPWTRAAEPAPAVFV